MTQDKIDYSKLAEQIDPEQIVEQMDTGRIGSTDRFMLSRRQPVAGSGIGAGALGAIGIGSADAQSSQVGTIGQSNSRVDLFSEDIDTVTQTIGKDYETSVDNSGKKTTTHTPTGQRVQEYDPNRQSGISFISFPMVTDALSWGNNNDDIVADIEFEKQFFTGQNAQSHTLTLNNTYDRVILYIKTVTNDSGANQDIGFQVNGVTSGYDFENKTNAANNTLSTGSFIPFGSTFANGNQTAGKVEMVGSSNTNFQADLSNLQVAPGGEVSYGFNTSIPGSINSITVTGASGDISIESVVAGWSFKANI
jgi:hypothetical protein